MTPFDPFLIFVIGLLPALFSLLLVRKAETQARERLHTAMDATATQGLRRFQYALSSEHRHVEGIGYLVGDFTCRFNARSAYLRCAVNPSGPCKECPFYEPTEISRLEKGDP